MKLGFVFPGQGSQFVGMGKDYYEKYECVRNVYDKASQILGFDIAKLSFEGPEEELNQTKNTQLAILVMSLAISELLKQNNIEANISAGLSLGEYSALIYSNIISFEDGIKIVQKRGTYMQEYLPQGNWSMAAILGLDDNTIEEVCKKVTSGFVVPANYNCQGQVAISGEKQAVEEAMDLLKQAGAKRAIELKTSGPFHTEKLQEASKKLYEALQEIQINKISDKKVIKNIDAIEYTDADNIKQITAALKEKYGDDIEIIDSFISCSPDGAKPLWFLGESLKKLSRADIAVFSYKYPTPNERARGIKNIHLTKACKIEEMCAKSYDVLCLYIDFEKYEDLGIVVGNLTTKRPNFTE